MATDFSNISVSGRLGRDAEIKHTPNGATVCEFSIASNFRIGREEQAAWYRCALWGQRGESLQPYLEKGTLVIVGGSFSPREWETKDGEKRVSLDINVNEIAFGGGGAGEGKRSQEKEEEDDGWGS